MKSEKQSVAGGDGANGGINTDLESQLSSLGVPIGEKILELLFFREKGGSVGACSQGKRETKLVTMLHFINNQVFKSIFGKPADGLEQSMEDDDEYRILDKSPLTNKFANMGGKALSGTNCAAFIAGMIEGMLCSSKFHCKVTAHLYGQEEE